MPPLQLGVFIISTIVYPSSSEKLRGGGAKHSASPPALPYGGEINNRHMILTVAVVTVVLLGFAICLTDESEAVDVSSSAALADELNNADGEKTITLTANITDLSTLTTIGNGADVTLDLAGFDISMTGDGRIVIDSGASLTVKDSSSTTVSEQGNVSGIKSEMIEVEGTLNIQGGTFGCSGSESISIQDDGTFNMTGGVVNDGTSTSVYFRGTVNLLGGEVGKVSGYTSNSPVINIGSPDNDGPVIGKLSSGKKAIVNFYSGTVKTVTSTISPQSSFTEEAVFEDSSIKNYLIPGYIVIENTDTGPFHLKTNDKSSSVAKIERESFTIYHLDFDDASNSMTNGDTLTLLANCEQELSIPVYDSVVDLNGFDVTVMGDDSVGIKVRTEYSLKDWTPDMVVTIRSADEASVSAATPITVRSGNSQYTLTLNIEGSVTLTSTSDNGSIILDTATRMSYTQTNVSSIANGGFLAELEDGAKYIFGSVAKALDADADKSVTLLNDYTLGSLGIDGEQGMTYTLDLNGKTTSPEYGEALKLYGDGATFIVKNGKLCSNSDAVSIGISNPIDNDISVAFEDVDIVSNGSYAIVNNGTSNSMDNVAVVLLHLNISQLFALCGIGVVTNVSRSNFGISICLQSTINVTYQEVTNNGSFLSANKANMLGCRHFYCQVTCQEVALKLLVVDAVYIVVLYFIVRSNIVVNEVHIRIICSDTFFYILQSLIGSTNNYIISGSCIQQNRLQLGVISTILNALCLYIIFLCKVLYALPCDVGKTFVTQITSDICNRSKCFSIIFSVAVTTTG